MTVVDLRLAVRPSRACVALAGPSGAIQPMDHPVASPSSLRSERAIAAACMIYARLTDGATIPQVLACEKDDNAVAMGHLLHCATTKGQMTIRPRDAEDLASQLLAADGMLRGHETVSRQTLMATLYGSGLIPADLPVRNLKPAGTTPTAKTFIAMAEAAFGVSFEKLASTSRQKQLLKLRFRAIWSMRHCCGYSLAIIGEHFGNRDHTTVLNAINQAEIARSNDVSVRERLDAICDRIDRVGVEQAYGMIRNATRLRVVG